MVLSEKSCGKVQHMKLVGELKDKVAKTHGMEEKRAAIAKAGMELNDNELEQVCGGTDPEDAQECSQSFSHTRQGGKAWNTVNSKIQGGENLAFGFDTAGDDVAAWMNSPTHRDNILYDDFSQVSISINQEDDGTGYGDQEEGF